jgi:hypothetical protein
MGKKRDRTEPRLRLSPTNTVANLTDDLMASFNIPRLPDKVPSRLSEAVLKRANSLLFLIKEAKREQYVGALEIRLVRDAHRAVLTAYELGLQEAEVLYARFRSLVEDLGYTRTDVGFTKQDD